MFKLTMLKAGRGDALWLSFGDSDRPRHVLIDGGEENANAAIEAHVESLRSSSDQPVEIELLVVTHTDADHINGASWLIKKRKSIGVSIKAIWFNGYLQLFQSENALGYSKAEDLSAIIRRLEIPHNQDFFANTVTRANADDFPSTCIEGLRLTVLGPMQQRLDDLRTNWSSHRKENLGERFNEQMKTTDDPADDLLGESREPNSDTSAPNGSSIVLLAEYEEVTLLLAGDAFAGDIETSLTKLRETRDIGTITAFKLPHHGSVRNLSASLITCVGTRHYLISTNGKNDKHPHIESIRLILTTSADADKNPRFHFNYEKPRENVLKWLNDESIDLGDIPGKHGLELDLGTL